MARHEELRLVIWGPLYPWVYENIPRDRIEHHNWVPYDAYKIKLSALDFDIALAPLVGNKFNMFKSCIKWYEVSALADPKPILAAREAPYADEIQDGKTGFLFDMPTEKDPTANEFLFKLERLIRSEKLRRELATNAREWVIQNRSAISTVGDYWEWLKETRERYEAAKIKQAMR
jgi:glycosyltransferase involved in cell wall biosynthesis